MKKSLLLSIVMTLVLVVAMSTATFAWYTANATATATASRIQAESAASNIQISNAEAGTYAQSVKLDDVGTVAAVVPTAELDNDGDSWRKATVAYTGDTPTYTWTDGSVTAKTVWLYNNGGSAVNVNATAAAVAADGAAGDISGKVQYAIFIGDTLIGRSNYKYVTSANEATNVGTAAEAEATSYSLLPKTATAVTIYIWIEGIELVNTEANYAADVTVTFAKAA